MSEHSLDELKRQYEAAVHRTNKAIMEKLEAEKRYTEKAIADKLAEFAARGITPGSKVRLITERWNSTDKTYKEAGFLGVEAGYLAGQTKPIFSRLKKDGTPSKSKAVFFYSDVEPFEASKEDAS